MSTLKSILTASSILPFSESEALRRMLCPTVYVELASGNLLYYEKIHEDPPFIDDPPIETSIFGALFFLAHHRIRPGKQGEFAAKQAPVVVGACCDLVEL